MTYKLRTARWAMAAAFFLNGAGFASWAVRIPDVRERIGLTESGLGLAMMGVALGALITMPLAGGVIARRGSAPVYRVAALAFAAALVLLAYSASQTILLPTLVLLGAANSAVSVSLNTQSAAFEKRLRRPVMSGFHAVYSLGALFGAAAGGLIATWGLSLTSHLLGGGIVMALVATRLAPALLPPRGEVGSGAPAFARPSRELLLLGLVAFCVLFGEGAAVNWAAVYLRDVTGVGAGLAALGFGAFSLTMALGRLAGDPLVQRFGASRLLRFGGLLAVGSVALALATGELWGGLLGLAGLGAGLSVTYPTLMRLVARSHALAPAPAIAAVSTIGYLGFLAGPALIGFVAEAVSLRAAFTMVAVTSFAVAALAGVLPGAQAVYGTAASRRARAQEPELAGAR